MTPALADALAAQTAKHPLRQRPPASGYEELWRRLMIERSWRARLDDPDVTGEVR